LPSLSEQKGLLICEYAFAVGQGWEENEEVERRKETFN